mgnify:FL=1
MRAFSRGKVAADGRNANSSFWFKEPEKGVVKFKAPE